MLFFVHSANKNQSLSSLILNDTFSFFHFLNNVSNVTSSIFSAGRRADIPLLNVFTWIRPLRLADEENHWEYRRLPGYSEPKQGDIAVFNSPADPQLLLVKRITRVVKKGEPLRIDRRTLLLYRSLILRDGGKVMEKDGKIYIDGKSSSQYIPKQRFYYMEGDNRMNSHDSRSFGFISEEAIIGKFDFVLFSIDSQKQWWKAIRLRRMMMRFP